MSQRSEESGRQRGLQVVELIQKALLDALHRVFDFGLGRSHPNWVFPHLALHKLEKILGILAYLANWEWPKGVFLGESVRGRGDRVGRGV